LSDANEAFEEAAEELRKVEGLDQRERVEADLSLGLARA
jgi:hypothetical protein